MEKAVAREADPSEWKAIIDAFADHNFENSLSYVNALAKRMGHKIRLMYVESPSGLVGAAAIRMKTVPVLGRGVAYVSSGPLWRRKSIGLAAEYPGQVMAAFKSQLVDREGHILLARLAIGPAAVHEAHGSVCTTNGFYSTSLVRNYHTVLIDLRPDEQVLRANLHSKWRNMLNQSAKSELTLEIGHDASYWQRFLALFSEMKEAKEFDEGLGPQFFAQLDCRETGLIFLMAQKDGKDVGSVIISALGDTAIYLFGATNTAGRDLRAGYHLIWSAMIHCKNAGFRNYDLGGIDTDSNHGGYQFKTRMGGEIVDAAGPFQAVPVGVMGKVLVRALTMRHNFTSRKSSAGVKSA